MPPCFRQVFIVFLITLILPSFLFADESHHKKLQMPVDISFAIVDLKYNTERGAQICEIQHGVSSSFKGCTFVNEGSNPIAQNLLKELDKFHDQSWLLFGAFMDETVEDVFIKDKKWILFPTLRTITLSTRFLIESSLPINDPADINTYHGLAILKPSLIKDRESLQDKFPGVIFLDNAIYSHRRDKHKMTELLMGHPLTKKHKPKWGLYQLENEEGLIDLINNDIGSDLLVIKPLRDSLGRGVIILKRDDLNEVMEYLFKRKPQGLPNTDPAYEFWLTTKEDCFLVEEFIDAQPVSVPHLDGKLYAPTIRLAFLMIYNKKEIEIVCLGGYYKFPEKSLSEEGSLNERYKTCCEPPYYSKGDPETMKLAEEQIKNVLFCLYQKFLGIAE